MQSHHVKRILDVLVYIEKHIEEPLLLSKLSQVACISPYHFHRLFKAYLSMTPKEYIKRIRMIQSAKQLQYSHAPIIDIALAAGYEDPSSFTRAFLQSARKSPSLYRKEKQEKLARMQGVEMILKPQYVHRKEEMVLFFRKTGDYRETVIAGMRECLQLFQGITRCFGMALDDPLTIPRKECRFDFCVNAFYPSCGKEWGQKRIAGGKYAVFTYSGPFFSLEAIFTQCFYQLYRSGEMLRFSGSFCEYIGLPKAPEFHAHVCITAKYYVPIVESR